MAFHSQVNGTTAIPWRSSLRRLSLLEKLKGCQEAWCPKAPWDREEAHAAIFGTPAGSFLVVRDAVTTQPSLLCVSAGPQNEVLDYDIKCTGTVFQLSESRLSFSDLPQLVLFYSLTRDVLAVCLSIPCWIYSVTEANKDRLSQLEPNTWLSTPAEQQTEEMTHREPSNMMCSIQLTSTNGALCIINPLYLHEHGDDWLTHRPTLQQPSNYRQERRLSTTRAWAGAGLLNKRAISLDQESSTASTDTSGLIRAWSADSPPSPQTPQTPQSPQSPQSPQFPQTPQTPQTPPTPQTPQTPQTLTGVVLRRSSRDLPHNAFQRASTGSLSTPSSPRTEMQRHSSPVPQSPHRVSWIENGFWLPPPRPSSYLQPPSLELDSLSISSIEEEPESQIPSSTSQHTSSHRLADKVMNRISAMGQVFSGLVSQKKRLANRVTELSEKKGGAFADAVKGFVEMMLRGGTDPSRATGPDFLQEVRSALTLLREILLDNQDIQILLESLSDLNDSEIDSLVEISLHKVTLKPISTHLYTCIHTYRTNDGCFERLRSNLRVLEKNSVEGLGGSAGVGVPDQVSLERIQQRWTSMHETYSPNKKIQILLKVCKSIYHSMSANASSGTVFGADDFLPCLTWVLLHSDLVTLQVDTDYMMELLDPMQLQGEGGYYLTTLYAALYYISSFRPRLAARQLSMEAQNSINQWHRRRTLHCNQSRRSKHRRTIRRQVCRETAVQKSETENSAEEGKEVKDDSNIDEPEQQSESSTEAVPTLKDKTKMEQKPKDQSETSAPASDCPPVTQQVMSSKQEDGETLCVFREDNQRGP